MIETFMIPATTRLPVRTPARYLSGSWTKRACLFAAVAVFAMPGLPAFGQSGGLERYTVNPSGHPLSLQECVQEAIANNAKVLEAAAEVREATGGIIVAKAALYPLVTSAARVGYDNDDLFNYRPNRDGDNNDFYERWQIDFEVTQKIFDGTATRQKIAIAKLEKEASWNRYLAAVNDSAFAAEEAFFQILQARRELAFRLENYGRLNAIIDRQEALLQGGRVTRYDVLRTEVKAANELPEIEEVRAQVVEFEVILQQVMGRKFDPSTGGRIAIAGDFSAPRYNMSETAVFQEAIRNSPLLSAAEKQMEISSREEIVARSTKYPKIDALVGGRVEKFPRSSNYWETRTQFAFGVVGEWTIFDGFEAKGKIEEAKALFERDTIRREELIRQIGYDAIRALLDLREAQAVMKIGKSNVENARASLDSMSKSLQMGMATQLDLYDSNEDLFDAQILLLEARFDYQIAIARLQKVTSAYIRRVDVQSEPEKSR